MPDAVVEVGDGKMLTLLVTNGGTKVAHLEDEERLGELHPAEVVNHPLEPDCDCEQEVKHQVAAVQVEEQEERKKRLFTALA